MTWQLLLFTTVGEGTVFPRSGHETALIGGEIPLTMRSNTSDLSARYIANGRPVTRPARFVPRWVRMIAGAIASVAALGLLFAAQPPAAAIRSDLMESAEALRAIPANASPASVSATLHSALPGRSVQFDTAGFPTVVAVTMLNLDWQSCIAAERSARRLEGRVVVELDGYPSAEDCHDSNDMTWRLMP
jgi:hypothetical protein